VEVDLARHHDDGRLLSSFAESVLVVCPRCDGRAVVASVPGQPEVRNWDEWLVRPRRLVCTGCGAIADWKPVKAKGPYPAFGAAVDPFFGRPLWLRTRCVGHLLWAYNHEHVAELADYIGARLRERGPLWSNQSMVSRLPRWLKAADNRTEVLAGLARLRVLADVAVSSARDGS
jgi:hypothetical protein